MCCIYGVLIHPDSPVRTNENLLSLARGIFAKSFQQTEGRGKDASGFFAMHNDGNWQLIKAPVRASEFVYFPEYSTMLEKAFTPTTNFIIAHARQKTKGSEHNPLNNHPVEYKSLVGVHNGSISNDDSVFETLDCERFGEVDTEALVACIHEISTDPDSWVPDEITDAGKLLSGTAAAMIASKNVPDKLMVLRASNPLDMLFFDSMGLLFFCSEKEYLRSTLNTLYFFKKYFGYAFEPDMLNYEDTVLTLKRAAIINLDEMSGKLMSDFDNYISAFDFELSATRATGAGNTTKTQTTGGNTRTGNNAKKWEDDYNTCTTCKKEVFDRATRWHETKPYCYQCHQKVTEEKEKEHDNKNTHKTPTIDPKNYKMEGPEITFIAETLAKELSEVVERQREDGLGVKWHEADMSSLSGTLMRIANTRPYFKESGVAKPNGPEQIGAAYELGYLQGAYQIIWRMAHQLVEYGREDGMEKARRES